MEHDKEQLLDYLREVDEYDFEHFISDLWEEQGWDTKVSQASNDRGIDVIAEKGNPFPQRHLIQAKRYGQDNTVGVRHIREYSSLHNRDNVDAVIVVTTSSFTSQAEEEATNLNVKLIDGTGLYEIIVDIDAEDLLNEYTNHVQSRTEHSVTSEATATKRSRAQPDHPFGNIPNPDQSVNRLQNERCPLCDEVGTVWTTKNINTSRRWECDNCGRVWRNYLPENVDQTTSEESETTDYELKNNKTKPPYEIPHGVYHNEAWERIISIFKLPMYIFCISIFWVVLSVIFSLAGLNSYSTPLAIAGGIILILWVLSIGAGVVLFIPYVSRDKDQLATVTDSARPRHPIVVGVLLYLTCGLYVLFYPLWRASKYTVAEDDDRVNKEVTEKNDLDAQDVASIFEGDEENKKLSDLLDQTVDIEEYGDALENANYEVEEFAELLEDSENVEETLNDIEGDNWAEIIDQLQAELTEEDTQWDVLSKTKAEETEWPRRFIDEDTTDDIRSTIQRSLAEALQEQTTAVTMWNSLNNQYTVTVEFNHIPSETAITPTEIESVITIGKKREFGDGVDFLAEDAPELAEEFGYELTEVELNGGAFMVVEATRREQSDNAACSRTYDTVVYIIEQLCQDKLQGVTIVSVVDENQIST